MAEHIELALRYGANPHQTPARTFAEGRSLPIEILGGAPGYINLLDALNAWQLVRELRAAVDLSAAASFKHVSPAGAAVATPLSASLRRAYQLDPNTEISPLARAYARARGADRVASFGDFIALSDTVDRSTADLIRREVSDGVIAPGYDADALAILRKKQRGKYLIVRMDPNYEPADSLERREVFGITLEQRRNNVGIEAQHLANVVTKNRSLPETAVRDLLVALVTSKYTQSNTIVLAAEGQAIGVGAGQQSRILCTRLACGKADTWRLRQHPSVLDLPFRPDLGRTERDNAIDGYLRDDLTAAEQMDWLKSFTSAPTRLSESDKRSWIDGMSGVAMASDGFIPFRDNIDRASRSGVAYVAQPGGSLRDEGVIAACDEYGMAMSFTGIRLFHH